MSRPDRRRIGLACLVMANLVCWAGAAAVVGLVASDRVDLGLETLVRREQAAVATRWQQALAAVSRPTPDGVPGPSAPMPLAQAESVAQTEPTDSNLLPASAWFAPSTPAGGWPPATPTAGPGVPSASTGLGGAIDGDQVSTPGPTPTLVTSPLLLADPEISTLGLLNAEMSRSASARPVQIRYGEEALNREIDTLTQNNPDLPFRNVQVDLQRDRVVVTGSVTVLGFQVKAEITGRVLARDCRLYLEIDSVSAAGVMTPKFVSDQVEQMMLEAMAWYPADYPLCLEQLVMEETRATAYGYRR